MTPPPFDPELAPVVETLRALRPPLASLDDIPGRRELNAAEHRTVEELAAAYPAYQVAEEYAGDVPLLVMRPARAPASCTTCTAAARSSAATSARTCRTCWTGRAGST